MKHRSSELNRRQLLQKSSVAAVGLSVPAMTTALIGQPPMGKTQRRKIRIAVVGGGFGCDFHWHEHPLCEVTAVSDLRPDRRRKLQERYRCDAVYDSLEILLRQARNIDAVAIFTEAPNHEKHVRLCMQRDLHVISAVPACVTLEEAERLNDLKVHTGMTYMMAETSYYRHYCIAARELFREGKFGNLFYSEVEYYHPTIGAPESPLSFHDGERTWRYGYPPMLYPTHSTGLLIGVTGERFTKVSCLGWGNPDNRALTDNAYASPFSSASAMFQTDRGNICRCNVFWDGTAEGERAQWFGTDLAFYMPGASGQPFRLQGAGSPGWTELPDYWSRLPEGMSRNPGHGGSHPFLTHEFVTALADNRAPAVDMSAALSMTVPGIVAHESAGRGGEQLTIPRY